MEPNLVLRTRASLNVTEYGQFIFVNDSERRQVRSTGVLDGSFGARQLTDLTESVNLDCVK